MSLPKLRFKDFNDLWHEEAIEKLIQEFRLGGNYSNSETETQFPLIKMGNLDRGSIKLNKIEYIEESESIDPKDKITYGDLFFNTRNTLDLVGKVSIWKNELPYAYYNSNLMLLKFSNNFFMNYAFNSPVVLKKLRAIATGTTSVAAIYNKDLFQIKLKTPSLTEQTKIANFLTAIDEKITQLTQKHDLLTQYKKGVMKQIFSQELRFKDDDGGDFPDWGEYLLKDALIKNSSKNKNSLFNLVQSVSNKHGFINQDELFEDRVIASKDLSNYYIIKKGAFAYNPSRIDVGSLAYKSDDLTSVVSPLYVSFYSKPNLINDLYLFNWFDTEQFKNQMNSSFEGSVRNTLSYDSLSKISVALPSLKEQTKIANFLTAVDDKITATQAQLKAVKQYKQGLLQQMFV